MFEPLELMREYQKLSRGEAKLSGIRYAIDQADMAKDYGYMLYFRYVYADECGEYEDGLLRHIYLVFPEMLKIFEEQPHIEMPPFCRMTASEAVQKVFMWVVNCADYFYQISLADMEEYFAKFKNFCLEYGYDMDDYYIASARFYRRVDKARALQSLEDYKKFIKERNINNAYSLDFLCEMEIFYDNIDEALKIAKPLLEGKYRNSVPTLYQYGRFFYFYMVQGRDMEKAGYYFELMQGRLKKLRMRNPFFQDTVLYLALTNMDAAWSFYKKEAPDLARSTIPMSYEEFTMGTTMLMRILQKKGREQVRIRLPKSLPCYRRDGCYRTEDLADYFDRVTREIVSKFDARNGTRLFHEEYGEYMMTAGLWKDEGASLL